MKVAVSGLFHTLQAVHFRLFDRILSMATSDVPITIVLLVISDDASLSSMLQSIRQVTAVHVLRSASEITETFLMSNGIDGITSFDCAPFALNLSWKTHKRIPTRPKFVLFLGDTHPDLVAAQSLFLRRFSPDAFTSEPVSDFAISSALEAARRAPSAGNLQAYSLVMIKNAKIRAKLARACFGQTMIADAPGLIAVVIERERSEVKYKERGRTRYAVQDATIAGSHLQLALEAHGLQSRWIDQFDDSAVQAVLDLGSRNVAGFIALGHAVPQSVVSPRREREEYVKRISLFQYVFKPFATKILTQLRFFLPIVQSVMHQKVRLFECHFSSFRRSPFVGSEDPTQSRGSDSA
jgi:nitroreductase